LWRTVVWFFGTALIIPIPWVLRWYAAWYTSEVILVERGLRESVVQVRTP
jgi:hypothetical protein